MDFEASASEGEGAKGVGVGGPLPTGRGGKEA